MTISITLPWMMPRVSLHPEDLVEHDPQRTECRAAGQNQCPESGGAEQSAVADDGGKVTYELVVELGHEGEREIADPPESAIGADECIAERRNGQKRQRDAVDQETESQPTSHEGPVVFVVFPDRVLEDAQWETGHSQRLAWGVSRTEHRVPHATITFLLMSAIVDTSSQTKESTKVSSPRPPNSLINWARKGSLVALSVRDRLLRH